MLRAYLLICLTLRCERAKSPLGASGYPTVTPSIVQRPSLNPAGALTSLRTVHLDLCLASHRFTAQRSSTGASAGTAVTAAGSALPRGRAPLRMQGSAEHLVAVTLCSCPHGRGVVRRPVLSKGTFFLPLEKVPRTQGLEYVTPSNALAKPSCTDACEGSAQLVTCMAFGLSSA